MRRLIRATVICRAVLFPSLVLASAACDAGSRRLVGDYRLRQLTSSEVGGQTASTYDLRNTAQPENKAGWSGAVLRLGWDVRYIVVLRAAPPTPYGVGAGWTVIDVNRGTQSYALPDAQLRQRPEAARIRTYRADSAWTKL